MRPIARHTSRLDSARHLLNRRQVRECTSFTPQPGWRNSALAGFQVALTALIALHLVALSPFSHLIGFASLGTLVALFGRFAPSARRGWIVFLCLLCQTLTVFSMSTVAWTGAPALAQLVLLAMACGLLFHVVTAGNFGPPGALIFIFAAGVSMGSVDTFQQVLERTAATASAAALGWFVCSLTEAFRHGGAVMAPEPARPARHQLIAVARIIGGAGAAAAVAHFLGGAHAAWAAMGAVAVLQGAHLHINMSRALQRTGGTIVGACLAGLMLSAEPSVWTVIALVALLSTLTEVIIGSNYGLGQILVTPMALLMSFLAAPELAGVDMARERVLDTVIGTTIGVVLAVMFSTLDDRAHLARRHEQRTG